MKKLFANADDFGIYENQLKALYRKNATSSLFDRLFAGLRLKILPLSEIDKVVPKEGTIVEIGCGHGIITNFLSLTSESRKMIGVDIDSRRIDIAKSTIGNRKNIDFVLGDFRNLQFREIDMIILFGVICLIPFDEWASLFTSIHSALKKNGKVLFHDVKKAKSWIFRLHKMREHLFHIMKITAGAGFFVMEPKEIEDFLQRMNFSVSPLGSSMDVPLMSNMAHLLTKTTK